MRRREEIPLQKVTLFLYKGDFERLYKLKPRWGASKLIRRLVRDYLLEHNIIPLDFKDPLNLEELELL